MLDSVYGVRNAAFLFETTCVYFLFREGKLIYIGRTGNLLQRLIAHRNKRKFDSVYYIPCSKEEVGPIERYMIMKFRPEGNYIPDRIAPYRTKDLKRSTLLSQIVQSTEQLTLPFIEAQLDYEPIDVDDLMS